MPPKKKITAQDSTQQLFDLIRGKTNINKIVDASQKQTKKKKKKRSKKEFMTNDNVGIINEKEIKLKPKIKEELKSKIKENKKTTYDFLKGSLYESAEKPRRLGKNNNKRTKSPSSSKLKSFFNETVNFIPRDEHGRAQYPSIYHSAIGSPNESRIKKSQFKTPRKKKSIEVFENQA